MQTATRVGVRETRRIIGEYVVSLDDAISRTRFPDVVSISSNPMPDFHGPGHGYWPCIRYCRRSCREGGIPPRRLDVPRLQNVLVSQNAELGRQV